MNVVLLPAATEVAGGLVTVKADALAPVIETVPNDQRRVAVVGDRVGLADRAADRGAAKGRVVGRVGCRRADR